VARPNLLPFQSYATKLATEIKRTSEDIDRLHHQRYTAICKSIPTYENSFITPGIRYSSPTEEDLTARIQGAGYHLTQLIAELSQHVAQTAAATQNPIPFPPPDPKFTPHTPPERPLSPLDFSAFSPISSLPHTPSPLPSTFPDIDALLHTPAQHQLHDILERDTA
jgi:hypothetical protein